ncbi:autophagy-related protein 27 [Hysterangium stoloniferum]|nr:autophagy-related protein 27 [Hysterangium stoloniferum]
MVLSQSALDCNEPVSVNGVNYDFSSVASEQTIESGIMDTPPTKNVFQLRFNICQDLSRSDGISDADQCPAGTRACLSQINKKEGLDDRIITVVPVAQSSQLNPEYTILQSPLGISLQLHGPSYPPDSLPSTPQSLNLTLLCTQDGRESSPAFLNYTDGIVSVEWKSKSGCSVASDGDSGNDNNGGAGDGGEKAEEPSNTGGSSIGWFFLVVLIAFAGYFALGAYYNYNNFGATGWDLVPHRDFWRDVPYLFRDFADHLCTTLRPGHKGSRRGYMAV